MTDAMPTLGTTLTAEEAEDLASIEAELEPELEPEEVQQVEPIVQAKLRQTRAKRKPRGADDVFKLISAELIAQDEKWGQQTHPLHGGRFPDRGMVQYEDLADQWKTANDKRVKMDVMGWDSILLEETYEALSAPDAQAAVDELVQVAAVAVQTILSMQRKSSLVLIKGAGA